MMVMNIEYFFCITVCKTLVINRVQCIPSYFQLKFSMMQQLNCARLHNIMNVSLFLKVVV